jgi:hypothetical protein
MVFGLGKGISAAASKAVLRDCKRRLVSLRVECGIEDDSKEPQSSGDPFTDLVMAYQQRVTDARQLIDDELAVKEGDGREMPGVQARVDALILRLDHDLTEMNDGLYEAEYAVARAEQKKKTPAKIAQRKAVYDQRKATMVECQSLCVATKKMRDDVRGGAVKRRVKLDKHSKQRVKQMAFAEVMLADADKKIAQMDRSAAPYGDDETVDLHDEAATKQIMKEIDEEKKKIEKGLVMLVQQINHLKQLAHRIGDEIDAQSQHAEEASRECQAAQYLREYLPRFLTAGAHRVPPISIQRRVISPFFPHASR